MPLHLRSLANWLTSFLEARGLTQTDGRALFAYKATADEYRQLINHLTAVPLTETGNTVYCQGWLLYAAEWWKREYNGGLWRWEPLFTMLNRSTPNIAHVHRNVMTGREAWRQTEALRGGKKYLGYVAVNGGLPMRLLEGAHGSLARILKMVLEDAVVYRLDRASIEAAIKMQAAALPHSYRQAAVYDLLRDIVVVVIDLRASLLDEGNTDPIVRLNAVRKNWQEMFPLALESTAASTLIKGLVRSAATIRTTLNGPPFRIVRGLRFGNDGTQPPRPEVSFEMRSRASRADLALALNFPIERIPPSFQLLAQIDGREFLVGECYLRGDDVQLISKASSLPASMGGIKLLVSRYGATLSAVSLPGGGELESDEPWVFEETYPFAPLLGQGDCRVKAESALVLAPRDSIIVSPEADFKYLFDECLEDKALVQLQPGMTRFRYRGSAFAVTCDPHASAAVHAQWQGDTLHYRSSPAELFKGIPHIRYEDSSGSLCSAPQTELFQRIGPDQIPLSSNNICYGTCTLLWMRAGATALRTRAVLLPPDSDIQYKPGQRVSEGSIVLRNWPALDVASADEHIHLTCRRDGLDLHLHVSHDGTGLLPELPLLIRWKGGSQQLSLSYPARGAIIVDSRGDSLPRNSARCLSDLVGCRALLQPNPDSPSWYVQLSMRYDGGSLQQMLRYGTVQEIRLYELADAIRALLSSHPDLDRSVRIELINNHTTQASLDVGRYSTIIRLEADKTRAALYDGIRELFPSTGSADHLLFAIPLQCPEQEPLALPGHTSEGVFTGSWLVDLPKAPSGPWLLFTREDSAFYSRPAIIVVSPIASPQPQSPLREALGIADAAERKSSLVCTLKTMGQFPDHEDWTVVEHLVKKLGHLPLPCLDIWTTLAQVPSAWVMAFILLDGFAEQLATRFSSELPAEWLLVSPDIWIDVFRTIHDYYKQSSQERTFRFLRQELDTKHKLILHLQPGLKFIFQLAFHYGFDEHSTDVGFYAKNPNVIVDYWLLSAFSGETALMQRLIQRSYGNGAHVKWPTELKEEVAVYIATPAGQTLLNNPALKQLRIPPEDEKWSVLLLPFCVAHYVVQGNGFQWQQDPARLFHLRMYRQFDAPWFDDAYLFGLAYAYKDKIKK